MEYTKGECQCENCRLERAAKEMYEALKAITDHTYRGVAIGSELYKKILDGKEALAKADGR